jgi:hypothetical protein
VAPKAIERWAWCAHRDSVAAYYGAPPPRHPPPPCPPPCPPLAADAAARGSRDPGTGRTCQAAAPRPPSASERTHPSAPRPRRAADARPPPPLRGGAQHYEVFFEPLEVQLADGVSCFGMLARPGAAPVRGDSGSAAEALKGSRPTVIVRSPPRRSLPPLPPPYCCPYPSPYRTKASTLCNPGAPRFP